MTATAGAQFVGGTYLSGDEIHLGDTYRVEFADGALRLMRRVVQNIRVDHVWLEVATNRLVIESWLWISGSKESTRTTCFRNPDLSPAFEGELVERMVLANHEPCPRCGEQPQVTKGPTFWTAHCPVSHFPGSVSATPMRTKRAALEAWNAGVKNQSIS
jgi:hypothetical protein